MAQRSQTIHMRIYDPDYSTYYGTAIVLNGHAIVSLTGDGGEVEAIASPAGWSIVRSRRRFNFGRTRMEGIKADREDRAILHSLTPLSPRGSR